MPSSLVVLDETRQGAIAKEAPVSCWTTSISPNRAVVATTKSVDLGHPIHLKIAQIGSVRGHVVRLVEGGLLTNLELSAGDRAQLAGKIEWYRRRLIEGVPDRRDYERRAPADPNSVLLLPDGATQPCEIIDVSRSGATVAAMIQPEVSTCLAVGQIVGSVVRHINSTAFAMQFLMIHDEDKLDQMLRPMQLRLA